MPRTTFYSRLDLTPSHELGGRGEIVESLELMPEPMYRALEEVVGFVALDGEYEELRVASGDRLRVSEGPASSGRGRTAPSQLVLPPRDGLRGRGGRQVR